MNRPAVQEALSAIRDCALVMLENASYVQRELPNVRIDDPLRSQTAEICDAMVGTKHDIISELFEINELLESHAESAIISSRLVRSITWFWEDISRLHQAVMALRADSQKKEDHVLATILVEESAANVLNAFNRAKAAVEAATGDSNEKRNAESNQFTGSASSPRVPMTFSVMPKRPSHAMNVKAIDHIVLTVKDIEATCAFYARVLGMNVTTFGGGRKALSFGTQKINLHQSGHEFEPKAEKPTPGSADVCFVTSRPISDVVEHLSACEVELLEGPVERTGASGPLTSVYFRDPDGNLIEVSAYESG